MDNLVPVPSPNETLYYGSAGDPLVIVLHDWYGRLPWIDPLATALASRDFRVAVPDYLGGFCTTDDATAEGLMRTFDRDATFATIDQIVGIAQDEGSARVGVMGFSLGGWLALQHAQTGASDGTVAYYATLDADDHRVIPAPLQLHFAETDEWDDGEEPEGFLERLAHDGTPVETFTYTGTVHSFANATIIDRVDVRAAALAFARSARFFEKHLH